MTFQLPRVETEKSGKETEKEDQKNHGFVLWGPARGVQFKCLVGVVLSISGKGSSFSGLSWG